MRGKGTDTEQKEKALAMLANGMTYSEVAKELSLKYSTIYTWANTKEKKPELIKAREDKTQEAIDSAWMRYKKAAALIDRRLDRASDCEFLIDKIIDFIKKNGIAGFEEDELMILIRRFLDIKFDDAGKLNAIMNSAYDKHALMVGDPTVNHGGSVRFEDL